MTPRDEQAFEVLRRNAEACSWTVRVLEPGVVGLEHPITRQAAATIAIFDGRVRVCEVAPLYYVGVHALALNVNRELRQTRAKGSWAERRAR